MSGFLRRFQEDSRDLRRVSEGTRGSQKILRGFQGHYKGFQVTSSGYHEVSRAQEVSRGSQRRYRGFQGDFSRSQEHFRGISSGFKQELRDATSQVRPWIREPRSLRGNSLGLILNRNLRGMCSREHLHLYSKSYYATGFSLWFAVKIPMTMIRS